MKSIKTNPNSAKGPDKEKIVNKLYCILLTTIELYWLYFFKKKTDMIFIILVSNLKEISHSVFSWKKEFIKKIRCNSTVKIRFGRKKILNYAYVLKNGVGWYNIFFLFLHKACKILLFVSFSYRIRQCFRSSTIRFVPCAFFINKQFCTCASAFPNEFTVRSYEYYTGKHWILYWIQENKTATQFLRSRLFTYDIMKNFNSN
jgi:hypothetical protein